MVKMRVICKHPHDIVTVVLSGGQTKHLKEKHGIEDRLHHARHFDYAEIELGNYQNQITTFL